jgi:tetrahydromethanopterin S-methyltransferase subunit A
MVEKKEVPSGWPPVTGDVEVGDQESPVAVSSTGSFFHLSDLPEAALVGSDKTENIGLEKIMANVISNSNIRFLILAGAEVPGHVSGGAMLALHKNGIDPESHKIINTTAAIPFIENLPIEAVERFRKQVEVIDMIGTEDYGVLNAKIKELKEKDPGAYEEDPMVVKMGVAAGEAAAAVELPLAMPADPFMGVIAPTVENIKYKSQLIARDQKLSSGMSRNSIMGILMGLICAFIVLLPFIIWSLSLGGI